MAEKLEDVDLWLPEEFLGKGFFLEERSAAALVAEVENGSGLVRENLSYSSPNITAEIESDEEDYVAGLTRQMAHSFLAEDKASSFWDTRFLATSPQSTLCDAGIWSASCTGNPNVSTKASPPLSTFLEQREEDAMDLLYAAAGEVLRKKHDELRAHECRLLHRPKKPLVHTKSSAVAGSYNNQDLARQQFQAAQFHKLKQQQLIKQHLSSVWSRQNRTAAAISCRPHSLAPSWTLQQQQQQQQQPSSGMRAIFLNSAGARRESAGTGVFLPRRAGTPTANKPACSTVLLPARVVQALNLTLDDAGVQPRYPVHHEAPSARGKHDHNEQKRNIFQTPPATISGHETRLPKEWTY